MLRGPNLAEDDFEVIRMPFGCSPVWEHGSTRKIAQT